MIKTPYNYYNLGNILNLENPDFYREEMLVKEVTNRLEELTFKIRTEGISVSAKKRKGFVYVGDEFFELKIPTGVIEWLNFFCLEEKKLPSQDEIQQLSEAFAIKGISVPQPIVDYWLNFPKLNTQAKRKYLKLGLGKLAINKNDHPLHLKNWVQELLDSLNETKKNDYEKSIKSFRRLPEDASLRCFIEKSGGLTRATERTKHFIENRKIVPIEGHDNVFINDLDICLNIIQTFIKRQNAAPKTKVPLDFCALCWRRVRHKQDRVGALSIERRESNSYCFVHHPSREATFSKRTIDALKAAVKVEKKEYFSELDRLESGEMKKESKLTHLTKWLKSFAPKSELIVFYSLPPESWLEICGKMFKEASDIYPAVFEKIKGVPPNQFSTFPMWFFKVIDSLDDSEDKAERLYWQSIGVKEWTTFNGGIDEGWKVLLQIFRRYEANHYIMHRKRPRGPQKSGPKPTQLKAQIKKEIQTHLDTFGKVKTGLIETKLKTSRKTIAAVKRDMGLLK